MSAQPDAAHLLSTPGPDAFTESGVGRYMGWLRSHRNLDFDSYESLWRWSVTDLDGFWQSVWDYFGVRSETPHGRALGDATMPGTRWFPDARLNYARHLLVDAHAGRDIDNSLAVIAVSQSRERIELTFAQLRDQVARARAGLLRLGVQPGDRVVGYLPNIPEAIVAFLAAASIGAVWASCAPEFGPRSVVDRFAQIEPTVMIAVAGYTYGSKHIDHRFEVTEIREQLPTLRTVVHVPYGGLDLDDTLPWSELIAEAGPLDFESVAFDHPLYVLFSSGTTGKPKAIIHGHGGITLEHLKLLGLCWDVQQGDRFLWFTTTAWMIWNALVSGLMHSAAVVLMDGDPIHPAMDWQWQVAAETGVTVMGSSAGYLMACRKEGFEPTRDHDLSRVRHLAVSGSPLPIEGFEWVHERFGSHVLIDSVSGGTDVCSGMVGGSPLLPVWSGEISGPLLGCDVRAFDPEGNSVEGELGEMVVVTPMPSMPLGFWGDDDGSRYRETYFDMYPGVWRQGDWIRFTERGSCVITGRSDATLNRGGVRLGTSEFYAVVEDEPEVIDSLVIHLEDPEGGQGELLLFVVLHDGEHWSDELVARIRAALRTTLSPRHVPDSVEQVAAVPRNRTGKKLELPVKRILQGHDADAVASRDALADGASLEPYVEIARRRSTAGSSRT